MTTVAHNPYVAPRAALEDARQPFQAVRVFSVSGFLGPAGVALLAVAWVAMVVLPGRRPTARACCSAFGSCRSSS